jgi:NAD(P)-dependent dehydrogenase (short-subunit alcohol dehydrogenase family)|tara:strand:+ start:75154 stop:76080 length:927 start_codon:yes stop_codon:yes gene_type:complete
MLCSEALKINVIAELFIILTTPLLQDIYKHKQINHFLLISIDFIVDASVPQYGPAWPVEQVNKEISFMDTVVILGAGTPNGVGGALARRFASEGLHVVVSGRTQEKVDTTAQEVVSAGGSAEGFQADVTSEPDLDALFAHVASTGNPVAAVVFNAGSNMPIPFEKITAEEFESYWRIGCLGAFLTAKRAMPVLAKQGAGSLLFTGASASMRGRPNFSHFASAKAGLRNLAQALAREYGPQGVHVAHIIIDGVVNGDIVQGRFGGYIDSLGEDGALAPDAIAETFWSVHTQHRSAWTQEVDLRPYKETW